MVIKPRSTLRITHVQTCCANLPPLFKTPFRGLHCLWAKDTGPHVVSNTGPRCWTLSPLFSRASAIPGTSSQSNSGPLAWSALPRHLPSKAPGLSSHMLPPERDSLWCQNQHKMLSLYVNMFVDNINKNDEIAGNVLSLEKSVKLIKCSSN